MFRFYQKKLDYGKFRENIFLNNKMLLREEKFFIWWKYGKSCLEFFMKNFAFQSYLDFLLYSESLVWRALGKIKLKFEYLYTEKRNL
jgi:hypothetical protein